MKKIFKRVGGVVSKNSTTILTGIGVAGVFTTAVLGIKETPKAIRLMDEYKKEHGIDKMTKKEVIKTTWKCYIPAAASFVLSSACIIGAQKVNLRRNAALAGIYSLTETAFKEYKNKVVETIGATKEQEIKDEIRKEKIENGQYKGKEIIITGKGDMKCCLEFSDRYFESDIEKIRQAVYDLNVKMMHEDYVSLNDLYYELGLRGTTLGDMFIWDINEGKIELDFSSQLLDDLTPCLTIGFINNPKYNYRDY